MARPRSEPDKRRGIAEFDADQSLNMLLELGSEEPSLEVATLFFGERAKFFILHRWLETSLYEEQLGAAGEPTPLQTFRAELSDALLKLADNEKCDFFKVNRGSGPRGESHHKRMATLAACACLHAARTEDQKRWVNSKWNALARSSRVNGQDLRRLLDNRLQAEGDTPDKRFFLGIYASFRDLSDGEVKEQIRLVMSSVEQLVS
jgi:hypothetical protein